MPDKVKMGIAAGGLIKQSIVEDPYPADKWDRDRTITFNVQILNSEMFRLVTGLNPPVSPIEAKAYAKYGLPFFDLYEESLSVAGEFGKVKSVKQLHAAKRTQDEHAVADEPSIEYPLIAINPDGSRSMPFKPASVLKKEPESANAVQFN